MPPEDNYVTHGLDTGEQQKTILKYNIVFEEYPADSFTPTFIRENRRHVVINNCVQLCKKIITDIGIADLREQDYLLAKVGMIIIGQSMLGLQNQLVEMDHEADLALEAKFGKIEDYISKDRKPHKYTTHPTYIGEGCAICGQLKENLIHEC